MKPKRFLLLLIRHAQSEADLLDVHEGRADFHLTEVGKAQADAMALKVASKYGITKIYSSPLNRAKETAKALSIRSRVYVSYDDDLMEFNNGLLAGMDHQEAKLKYPRVENLDPHDSVYEQESLVEFRTRADRAIRKIIADAKHGDVIAVVTHGGTINQIYGAMMNLPYKPDVFFGTGDTGIHTWKFQNDQFMVAESNNTEHLIK